MQNNGKILLALLLGAAAGATLGVLFAPDSGINTRKKVSKWKDDLEEELSSRFEDGKEAVNEFTSKVKETANEWSGKAEEVKDRAKDEFDEMKSKAKQQTRNVHQ